MPKKKLTQKIQYHENEESFWDEIKTFFINFKELSLKQIDEFFEWWESDFNDFV